MSRAVQVARALVSVAVSVLTILFLYDYLAPIGLPNTILGPQYASLLGSSTYGALVPGGVAGILLFTILSRVGGVASAATAPSADDMMRRMRSQGGMGMGAGMGMPGMGAAMGMQGATAPAPLPADMSRSQYVILRAFRQGAKNSKDASKALSMDKDSVETDIIALKTNGYLAKNNRLTSKAIELLGN